jgi:hypothetical protein
MVALMLRLRAWRTPLTLPLDLYTGWREHKPHRPVHLPLNLLLSPCLRMQVGV